MIATTIFALSQLSARCPASRKQNKYINGEPRQKPRTIGGRNDDQMVARFVRLLGNDSETC